MKRWAAALVLCSAFTAAAEDATFAVKLLTPESALKAAQAALKRCRDNGYQVAVAVTDRMGVVQVVLRDRFAGPHTPDTATAKAYTAASFRTNTTELAAATQP
ncbi:MAG TPA: heme-binding protein, partial [Burkholderiales bacterium]